MLHFSRIEADSDRRRLKNFAAFGDVAADGLDGANFLIAQTFERIFKRRIFKNNEKLVAAFDFFFVDVPRVNSQQFSQLQNAGKNIEDFVVRFFLCAHLDILARKRSSGQRFRRASQTSILHQRLDPTLGAPEKSSESRLRAGVQNQKLDCKTVQNGPDSADQVPAMKAFVRWMTTLSFIFSQTAMAAKPPTPVEPLAHAKDLINKSGLTKKGAKLSDVFELTQDRLPLDFRYEVERFLQINPNFKLPQIDVRGVKNGNFEDLQMNFTHGKQSFSLLISLRGEDVGAVTYSLGGQNVHRKLTQADLADPVALMTSVLGQEQSLSRQFPFARLLYSEELASLKPEQAKAYLITLQQTIETMTKLQAAIVAGRAKKTSLWQQVVGEFALAAEFQLAGKPCLSRGGWAGTFSDETGACKAPPQALRAQDPKKPNDLVETCNPAVYGGTYDFRSAFPAADGTLSPGHCRSEAERMRFEPVFKWAAADQLDSEYKRVNDELNALSELCAREDSVKDKQKPLCEQLAAHAERIRQENSAMLALRKGPPGSTAATGTATGASASTGTAPTTKSPGTPQDDREAGPRGPRDRQDRAAATTACQGLPIHSEDLNCGRGNPASISCLTANGPINRYYCVCQPGSTQVRAEGGKTIECRAGRYGAYDRDQGRSPRGEQAVGNWYDKPVSFLKNNWAPLLALTGLVVGGMLLIKANESSQIEQVNQYYKMNAPNTPQFAPVSVTTLPTSGGVGGTAFPTIPGRPVTGGAVTPSGGYSFPAYTGVSGAPTNGVLRRGTRNSTPLPR